MSLVVQEEVNLGLVREVYKHSLRVKKVILYWSCSLFQAFLVLSGSNLPGKESGRALRLLGMIVLLSSVLYA